MSVSAVLEVAVGLMLIYYALGLIVNIMTKMIKDFLDIRAEALEAVLWKLFDRGDFLFKVAFSSEDEKKKLIDALNKRGPERFRPVPDPLLIKFAELGTPLAKGAKVAIQQTDEKWQINDSDKVYFIFLKDDEIKVYKGLFEGLKKHPLIEDVKPMQHKLLQWKNRALKDRKPSKISSDTFSLAVLSWLAPRDRLTSAAQDTLKTIRDQLKDMVQAALETMTGSDTKAQEIALEKLNFLDDKTIEAMSIDNIQEFIVEFPDDGPAKKRLLELLTFFADTPENQLKYVREGVYGLPDGKTRDTLLDLLDLGVKDIHAAHEKVTGWYNNASKNIADVYTQKVRVFVVSFACVVTVFLGVDTISIAQGLWEQPERDKAIEKLEEIQTKFGPEGLSVIEQQNLGPENIEEQTQAYVQDIAFILDKFDSLNVPITWKKRWGAFNPESWWPPEDSPDLAPPRRTGLEGFVFKVVGLLVTWVAVSQGSSFWYNILKKINPQSSSGSQSASGGGAKASG